MMFNPVDLSTEPETMRWFASNTLVPSWSRVSYRNASGHYRNSTPAKKNRYDIEIDGLLWSVWGSIHPDSSMFERTSRGRQYAACAVMACVAEKLHPLGSWDSNTVDNIITSGDTYYRESLAKLRPSNPNIAIIDLNKSCRLENTDFHVDMKKAATGHLYNVPSAKYNLASALSFFFGQYRTGVLKCKDRYLAIGLSPATYSGFFMFDCQSRDYPLFRKGQGSAYLLRTRNLQTLLYCIVITLNIRGFHVPFTIYNVDCERVASGKKRSLKDSDLRNKFLHERTNSLWEYNL